MTTAPARNDYLRGNYAPVEEEVSLSQLPVVGALPRELNGRYMRIGPNPTGTPDPAIYHWFSGEGMVHGVRLYDGRAQWYRNRLVRAEGHSPNTNVLAHGGRLLALIEGGASPVELGPDLDRMSVWDCEGALAGGFTAHPKIDPVTGHMHAVSVRPPHGGARYTVLDGDGAVTHVSEIPVDDHPMIHDMALTESRVVVFDLPVTLAAGMRNAQAGLPVSNFPFVWDDRHPARVGIMPHLGSAQQIQWVEVPRCHVFHVLNAYDNADGSLTLDVIRYDEVFIRDLHGPGGSVPTLVRWVINPATGNVDERVIGDYSVEFPRIDERLVGRPHRYGWFAGVGAHGIKITDGVERLHTKESLETGPLVKVDTVTGRTEVRSYGPGRVTMEPAFVPRPGGEAEDDGWILSVVHDANTNLAELVVLDAADIHAEPIARVFLPRRVPFGFHGNWIADSALL
ncbi:carotenoid oxygenase family protein [Streptomyces griseofuscus]|uniref:carotenoid oxygenase family protein n=1 Tax=Streptomyces griseofuscus TaxID=146922 RepID=UPI0033EE878E